MPCPRATHRRSSPRPGPAHGGLRLWRQIVGDPNAHAPSLAEVKKELKQLNLCGGALSRADAAPVVTASAPGFVADPGTIQTVGQLPVLTARLDQLARSLGVVIYGISGYRTPAHSVAVGGFADDPHTKGEAEDIGVNSLLRSSAARISEGQLARYGLYRPFDPSDSPANTEVNHIQLIPSSGPCRWRSPPRPSTPTPAAGNGLNADYRVLVFWPGADLPNTAAWLCSQSRTLAGRVHGSVSVGSLSIASVNWTAAGRAVQAPQQQPALEPLGGVGGGGETLGQRAEVLALNAQQRRGVGGAPAEEQQLEHEQGAGDQRRRARPVGAAIRPAAGGPPQWARRSCAVARSRWASVAHHGRMRARR